MTTTLTTKWQSSWTKKSYDGCGNGPPKPGTGPDIPTVSAAKKLYRARIAEKVAAAKQRYRQMHREKYLESQRRYYRTHRQERRNYDRERQRSEHRRAWTAQYRAKKREAAAFARKREAAALARKRKKRRTEEKIKALGPLKLTIELQDFLKSGDTSLDVKPQFSFRELLDDSYTLTDLDSGERQQNFHLIGTNGSMIY